MRNPNPKYFCLAVIAFVAVVFAQNCIAESIEPKTQTPFLYIINYEEDQYRDPEFREKFDPFVPELYHTGPSLRYLQGFGGCMNPMDVPFDEYRKEVRDYMDDLRKRGVKWITPYLCNQTIMGNDQLRTHAWEIFDRWDEFKSLGLGPKPDDLLDWMQREASGNLHYNYKRMCFLFRGQSADLIRYAPCPNNPGWRAFCDNQARLGAETGFDGYFIDNCIIHCYCPACQERFQTYLKKKYTPAELKKAFGTNRYSDITLYSDGDLRTWVHSFPEFIPWLENKYTPEERRIPFDTTGPLNSQHVDNSGGGMMMGLSSGFITDNVLHPGVQPSFENVRLENPALQTPEGRLQWAETIMFWGDSIGEMLQEMRDSGRRVNPDFFLMPNWGTMQRVYAAVGRAEDGHDMRRWRRGGEWQMYEEGYTTGQIAPGVILDYDMELRYAYAIGVRGMLLPYRLDGEDINDVALAETAASGGSILVDVFHYPEVQNRYKDFFREHGDLYEGYESAAEVALAYFFDQNCFLNIDHFRQVYALNRYLADQQIPFDHISEDQMNVEALLRYRAIVLPNIEYLSDDEFNLLVQYAQSGGRLVVVGNLGTYNRLCRERTNADERLAALGDRVVRFDSLPQVLPHDGIFLEPAIQNAEAFDALGEESADKYRGLAKLDEKFWFKRYQDAGPLTPVLADALERNPHLMEPWQASGVRNTVYRSEADGKGRMVVHLVNKNVPLAVPVEERKLQTVKDLTVCLPLPPNARVQSVHGYQTGKKAKRLGWHVGAKDTIEIPVKKLDAYLVLAVEYEVGAARK